MYNHVTLVGNVISPIRMVVSPDFIKIYHINVNILTCDYFVLHVLML